MRNKGSFCISFVYFAVFACFSNEELEELDRNFVLTDQELYSFIAHEHELQNESIMQKGMFTVRDKRRSKIES